MGEEKQIVFTGEEVREKIFKAIDKLSKTVKLTLGPKGRNVIIKSENDYYLTKDGVSVAKSIYTYDPVEQVILDLMKDIALATNKAVGDGTTTAIVIAEVLIKSGLELIKNGIDPDTIKNELEKSLKIVLNELDKITIPIKGKEDLKYIATISSNNNEEIGNIVSDAIYNTNEDSVVDFKESKTGKTYLKIVNGYTIKDAGYLDKRFVEGDKTIKLENPSLLLIDEKVTSLEGITEILDLCATRKEELLIMAIDFSDNIINILLRNFKSDILKVIPIKTPGIRNEKKDKLNDIASYTESDIYSKINRFPQLGKAESIIIGKYSTTIINPKANVKKAIKSIKEEYRDSEALYSKEKLEYRISSLLGKTSTIYVGGTSELEILETIDRVEDSINATKAAKQEGIIAGGGVALHNIGIYKLDKYDMLSDAIQSPFITILENAGIKNTILGNKINGKTGYNVKTGKIVNMLEDNIIDPVKVTKEALKNAVSIASMVLTTEALVLNEF